MSTPSVSVSTKPDDCLLTAKRYLKLADSMLTSKFTEIPRLRWKLHDAMLAYTKAAEWFRVCGRWQECAEAYVQAASLQTECCRRNPEEDEEVAASYYAEAANALSKANPLDGKVASLYCKPSM